MSVFADIELLKKHSVTNQYKRLFDNILVNLEACAQEDDYSHLDTILANIQALILEVQGSKIQLAINWRLLKDLKTIQLDLQKISAEKSANDKGLPYHRTLLIPKEYKVQGVTSDHSLNTRLNAIRRLLDKAASGDYSELKHTITAISALINTISRTPGLGKTNSKILTKLNTVKEELTDIDSAITENGLPSLKDQFNDMVKRRFNVGCFSPDQGFNQDRDWRNGTEFDGACYGYVEHYGIYRLTQSRQQSQTPLPSNFQLSQKVYHAQENQSVESIDTELMVKKRLDRRRLESDVSKRGERILKYLNENKGQELQIAIYGAAGAHTIAASKNAGTNKITFFDPNYGVFTFESDDKFTEFYTALHEKYIQEGDNFKGYEVRKVGLKSVGDESFKRDWKGVWRSVLTGSKYGYCPGLLDYMFIVSYLKSTPTKNVSTTHTGTKINPTDQIEQKIVQRFLSTCRQLKISCYSGMTANNLPLEQIVKNANQARQVSLFSTNNIPLDTRRVLTELGISADKGGKYTIEKIRNKLQFDSNNPTNSSTLRLT